MNMFNNLLFGIAWFGKDDSNVGIISKLLRGAGFWIDEIIYRAISTLYRVFSAIASGNLLSEKDLNALFGRVSFLLGLIMFFVVAFSVIKYIVDPDTITDKENGFTKVIQRVIIVVAMLGLSPFFFSSMKNIQATILNENVISKLILPRTVDTSYFGEYLSSQLFLSFYSVNERVDKEASNIDDANGCLKDDYIDSLTAEIIYANDFSLVNDCLYETGEIEATNNTSTGFSYNSKDKYEVWVMDFNFVFCFFAGLFVCWILLNYTIAVGIRCVQLAFLQIISPMAIVGYLMPNKNDNMFTKWRKVYFSTYVDVFIRIAVIDFVVYLIAILMDEWNNPSSDGFMSTVGITDTTGFSIKAYIFVIMVTALLLFAKKLPDLIKNIFPSMGDSGLSLGFGKDGYAGSMIGYGKSAVGGIKKTAGVAGRGVGFLGGGAIGAAMGYRARSAAAKAAGDTDINAKKAALFGAMMGLGRGAAAGGKKGSLVSNLKTGVNNIREADNKYRDLRLAGGSQRGAIASNIQDMFGTSRGTFDATQMENSKMVSDNLKGIFDTAENTQYYKDLMHQKEHLNVEDPDYAKKAAELQRRADAYRDKFVNESLANGGIIDAGSDINYTYLDIDGNQVDGNATITGGDSVKALSIYTDYNNLKVEIKGRQIRLRDGASLDEKDNPLLSDSNLEARDGKTIAEVLSSLQKRAQKSQSHIVSTEGYRAGQANKEKGSKK